MWRFTGLFLAVGLFIAPDFAQASDILGVAWDGTVVLIDESSGTGQDIGPSGFSGLNSLAKSSNGTFYSVAGDPLFTTASTLITIDSSTGLGASVAAVNGLDAGTVRAVAFSPGDVLYAIGNGGGAFGTGIADDLYAINLITGDATLIGNTGFSGIQGLAFGPDGTLYGWDVNSLFTGAGLVTINPLNGQAIDVNANIGESDSDIQGLAFASDGTFYGARHTLFTIDPLTGAVVAVGPNTLADIRGIESLDTKTENDPASTTTPEPASWFLLGLGLLVFASLVVTRHRHSKGAGRSEVS